MPSINQTLHLLQNLLGTALNAARQMMRDNKIDVIIIYAYDRFFRDQTYQTVFIYECRRQGVAVESITEQQDDSLTGRMTATILGVVAEVEHAKILERTQRGMIARIQEGKLRPGSTPLYGYTWKNGINGTKETHDFYVIDEYAASIIRYIYEQIYAGVSLRAIAHELNSQGVLTPAYYFESKGWLGHVRKGNGVWSHFTITHIAKNPAYMGKHRVNAVTRETVTRIDEITRKRLTVVANTRKPEEESVLLPSTTCPPIVDEHMWASAQQIIKSNKELLAHRPIRDPEAALLARGHVFCGHCGRPAVTLYRKDNATSPQSYRYACNYGSKGKWADDPERNCTLGTSHVAHTIDEWVWNYIVHLVAKADLESGQTLLEKIVANMGNPSDQKKLALETSLQATQDLLKQEETKRANAERVFQDALGRTYNQAHLDRIQETLDSCDKKVDKLHETIVNITVQLQADQEETNTRAKFLQQVRQLSQHIESADWLTKRLWLRILRIRVYIYRKGHYEDEDGHRWRLAGIGVDNMRDLVTLHDGVDEEGLS